jgi:O-methyltransferase
MLDSLYQTVRHRTLLVRPKLDAIWSQLQSAPPGDLAELGVYKGGVCRLMAETGRTVYAFDTFTGMPRDGYDPAMDWHKPGDFADGRDTLEYLSAFPNVRPVPGLFPATAVDSAFAIVHLDADLYASTLAGLEWFWPRVVNGGSIVLDDWDWQYCRGVEKAVKEYFGGRSDTQLIVSAPNQLTVKKC